MEIDLSMLNEVENKNDGSFLVRFYGWEPKCLSLGRNQKEFKTGEIIDTVRRPTGGRALIHDKEITYCITGKIPDKQSVIDTYKMISDVFIKAFSKLGIELNYAGEKGGTQNYCMNISSGADICYKGRKFIGSAQYRRNGFFLQHGSILKEIDYEFFEKVFGESIDKTKIATLKEINPNIKDEEIIKAIEESF